MPNDLVLTETQPKSGTDTFSLLSDPIENPDEKVIPDDQDDTLPAKIEEPDDEEQGKLDLGAAEEEEPKIDEDKLDFTPGISRKALVKEFPEIFKKFPQLDTTIYKMRAFEEIFPTLKDARNALDAQKTLATVEEKLARGDIAEILDSIRTDDKEAYLRILDNFLPTIFKLDESSYTALMGNIAKFFIKDLYAAGSQFKEDSEQQKLLYSAAKTLYQKIFGQMTWSEPKDLAKKVEKKEENSREQELMDARYDEVSSDIAERADNAIKAKLDEVIDPRGVMTPFVKEQAIEICLTKLESGIKADQIFKAKLDVLWKKAWDNNFSRESQDAIKQAYFSKAQVLLPDIIREVRAKALANLPRRASKPREEENDRVPSTPATRESRSNKPSRFRADGRPKTTMEILNED